MVERFHRQLKSTRNYLSYCLPSGPRREWISAPQVVYQTVGTLTNLGLGWCGPIRRTVPSSDFFHKERCRSLQIGIRQKWSYKAGGPSSGVFPRTRVFLIRYRLVPTNKVTKIRLLLTNTTGSKCLTYEKEKLQCAAKSAFE